MNARKECNLYRDYLLKLFPVPDNLKGEVWYSVKSFPHEYGSYYEVCVYYNPSQEGALEYALNVESDCPAEWDDEYREKYTEIFG